MGSPKIVKINKEKLISCMEEAGKAKRALSLELGRSESYINYILAKGTIDANIEKLICMILGKPPGYFEQKEEILPAAQKESAPETKVFQNIYKEILNLRSEIASTQKQQEEIKSFMESVDSKLDRILSKANANTVQLEKMKESVKVLSMTEPEKAACFLKELLVDGKMLNDDVLKKCDAKGFKREAVFKAKDELQVKQVTTGYGKNQKKWWVL